MIIREETAKVPIWMYYIYIWYALDINFNNIRVDDAGFVSAFHPEPNKLPTLKEVLNGGRKLK